jgi:hypothetical protein
VVPEKQGINAMNVFVSHAAKDEILAAQLADALMGAEINVLDPSAGEMPDDSWADSRARALRESDFMVILITPGAIQSEPLVNDIEYALTTRRFRDRMFTVIVGPTMKTPEDVPWILWEQPHKQIESSQEFGEVVDEVMGLATR